MNSEDELSALEKRTITLALRGSHSFYEILRQQLPLLKVKRREVFEGGFFVDFSLERTVKRVEMAASAPPSSPGYPPSVNAQLVGHPDSIVTFVVWLDDEGAIGELDVTSMAGHQISLEIADYCNFQEDDGRIIEG